MLSWRLSGRWIGWLVYQELIALVQQYPSMLCGLEFENIQTALTTAAAEEGGEAKVTVPQDEEFLAANAEHGREISYEMIKLPESWKLKVRKEEEDQLRRYFQSIRNRVNQQGLKTPAFVPGTGKQKLQAARMLTKEAREAMLTASLDRRATMRNTTPSEALRPTAEEDEEQVDEEKNPAVIPETEEEEDEDYLATTVLQNQSTQSLLQAMAPAAQQGVLF